MGVDQIPLLSVGGWLLDDLTPPGSEPARASRDDLKGRMFTASFLWALREQAIESIADPTSFSDQRSLAVAQWCGDRALVQIGRMIPVGDPFWIRFQEVSTTGLDLSIEMAETPVLGRWSSTAIATALAACYLAEVDADELDAITGLVDDLCAAFQIWDELSTLTRDLGQGRLTFPIAHIAHTAGIPVRPMPDQLQILGAMVVTDALETLLDIASARRAAGGERARALDLPILTSFLDDVAAADIDRRERMLGGKTDIVGPGIASFASVGTESATEAKAISMAEAFLLSDLTFRESWETHREGMLGADEVSARFPAGLILEILSRTGHSVGGAVDDFIAHANANGFRYYDHPGSDPDSDTVGAVLRLLRYANEGKRPSPGLSSMLACIDQVLEEGREIPVWLGDCAEPNPERPPTLTLGGRCGTVAAHLLLGLAELGDEYAPMIGRGETALFDRIAEVGLGANVNYPPRYALAMYFRLLNRGRERTVDRPARDVLTTELERRSSVSIASAQEAALAVLAARAAHRPDLIHPAWKAAILKQQRFDGSWIGEPFAVAPNRGWHVSVYSSTTLTTALCYDALAGTNEGMPAEA